MSHATRPLGIVMIIVATAIATTVASVAFSSSRPTAPPTSVATINLSRVLDGLDQWADSLRKLNDMAMSFQQEEEQRRTEIDQMLQRLENLVGEELRRAEEEAALKQVQFMAWAQVRSEQLDLEASLQLRNLYRSIRRGAEELAEAEGYHLIVVDDSSSEFSFNPNVQVSRQMQVRQQIISRRVLYGRNAIDVTEPLIVRMNNAWRAGG